MELKITKKRDGSFESNGNTIEYYWYKAIRKGDGVTIEFGSKREYEVGDELEDVNIEKTETAKGGFRYKEVVEK